MADNTTFATESAEPSYVPLADIGCDEFERKLLPFIRELTYTCRHSDKGNWLPSYRRAEELWGARTGLPLVHGLSQIVVSLVRIKGDQLNIFLPHDQAGDKLATRDEQLILLMIHHFRREHINSGSDFLLDLIEQEMDFKLLDWSLKFADRHSCGTPRIHTHEGMAGSLLQVVRR